MTTVTRIILITMNVITDVIALSIVAFIAYCLYAFGDGLSAYVNLINAVTGQ